MPSETTIPDWHANDPRAVAMPSFALRLFDERVLIGRLTDFKLTFTTSLGPLTVFAADIRKIEFATTNPYDLDTRIGRAIHRLGSEHPKEAEAELLAIGARAFGALVAAAQCDNGAISRRTRALAVRIKESVPPEFLSLRKLDVVHTRNVKFAGKLDASNFALETPTGVEMVQMTDLHSLTQLRGQTVEIPRPDPGCLARVYTNWFGANLAFTVTGTQDGDVFGSNPYTLGSTLAAAAVHACLVQPGETKVVRVEIILAPPTFAGATRNGVTSFEWAEPEPGAFRFVG